MVKREAEKVSGFKERFNNLRGDMTQDEFAKFLGISRPTVGFYENGERIPDAVILKRIAQKCSVSSDWLLGLSPSRNPGKELTGEQIGLSDETIIILEALNRDSVGKQLSEVLNWILSGSSIVHFLDNLRRLRSCSESFYEELCSLVDGDISEDGEIREPSNIREYDREELETKYLLFKQLINEITEEISCNWVGDYADAKRTIDMYYTISRMTKSHINGLYEETTKQLHKYLFSHYYAISDNDDPR